MKQKVLITSALLYANGPLHFGHVAGAYLPADVHARFRRLIGDEVLYLSGSDEYGVPITLSSEMAGRSPKEHVDIFDKINRSLFEKLSFSFDHFARTTWQGHNETVCQFFLDLQKNGHIEEKIEDHLFSEKENRFLADRYVVGICPKCGFDKARGDECQKCGASYEAKDLKEPKSKLTSSPLILKKSKHWYLRFDHFREKLKEWITAKEWKKSVINFAMDYIENLHPRAITRDSNWGVPLPIKDSEGKVFYVWFDAPIGYISAAKEWAEKRGNKELWKEFWCDGSTECINFIGKDNIPFHAVFFPAMIMGQDAPYKLVDEVPANEFLLLEGKQFSKSDNWTIDLEEFCSKYSSCQIRYALAANAPETSDSDFSFRDFQTKANGDLLGKLGNFVHRTLVFKETKASELPLKPATLNELDKEFHKAMRTKVHDIKEAYKHFSLRKAAAAIMELASLANSYFDQKKPWVLVKEGKTEDLQTTLYYCFECIKNLAIVSFPIIPDSSQKIFDLLGYTGKISDLTWDQMIEEPFRKDNKLKKSYPLFRKIEDEEIEEEIKKLGSPSCMVSNKTFSSEKKMIDFETFQEIDMRVGKILDAEAVPKSKKLLKLTVDVGFERRIIVSGIAEKYQPEDLKEKKVLVIVNLKPIKIMGIQSQGMLLAASLEEHLELPFFHKIEPGAEVR